MWETMHWPFRRKSKGPSVFRSHTHSVLFPRHAQRAAPLGAPPALEDLRLSPPQRHDISVRLTLTPQRLSGHHCTCTAPAQEFTRI